MEISRICLDWDDVMVDFVGGACKAHRVDRTELDAIRVEERTWFLEPALTRLLGRPISREAFWKPIDEGRSAFWYNLERLPWLSELWDLVSDVGASLMIVTGPSLCPSSYEGKARQIKSIFGRDFDNFIPTVHKHWLAQPGVLLIDDREENIDKFIKHGGTGIVFPNKGNSLHSMSTNPVPYVKEKLEEIMNA